MGPNRKPCQLEPFREAHKPSTMTGRPPDRPKVGKSQQLISSPRPLYGSLSASGLAERPPKSPQTNLVDPKTLTGPTRLLLRDYLE